MKTLIPIAFRGSLYEITYSNLRIIHIQKVMEDSGICREVKFNSLPQELQERILNEIQKEEE